MWIKNDKLRSLYFLYFAKFKLNDDDDNDKKKREKGKSNQKKSIK